MEIDSNLVKKLRVAKGWSQEQLSEASGLSLRTVQRLENGGNASIESLRALAAAFGVDPNELLRDESATPSPAGSRPQTPLDAVKTALSEFANFSGRATRYEYWWFLLFVTLVLAVSTVLHEKAYQIAALILLLPFAAAGARRLNDANYSPWLQLLWLVPFAQIVVLYYLAQPGSEQTAAPATKSLDAA